MAVALHPSAPEALQGQDCQPASPAATSQPAAGTGAAGLRLPGDGAVPATPPRSHTQREPSSPCAPPHLLLCFVF